MRHAPRLSRSPRLAFAFALAIGLSFAPGAVRAEGGHTDVDAELVFGVDISYSMDHVEQELQRDGYAQALTSPQFLDALKSNVIGKIAVAYMQWASYRDQDVVLDWTLIDGPETAKAAAAKLAAAPYRRARRTSISGGIDAAARLFEENGFNGTRKIIDISGDGPNNDGRVVTLARDEAVARGFTINGLPLVGIRQWLGPADIKDLDVYYEDCVIGGPDSFMVTIHDRKDFIEATRSKLVREIARLPARQRPLIQRARSDEPRISCTIGENLWRGRWGN